MQQLHSPILTPHHTQFASGHIVADLAPPCTVSPQILCMTLPEIEPKMSASAARAADVTSTPNDEFTCASPLNHEPVRGRELLPYLQQLVAAGK